MIPTMITIQEASEKTGLSYYCIRHLCKERKIAFIQVGRKRLINLEKLCEYLNQGEMLTDD